MMNEAAHFFIDGIHHVQIAIPPGGEELARDFFRNTLCLHEVKVPPNVSKRAIAWFEQGSLRVHVGIDADFHPSSSGHPAFSVQAYDSLIQHFHKLGISHISASLVGGSRRCHIFDPFGNRIELIEALSVA